MLVRWGCVVLVGAVFASGYALRPETPVRLLVTAFLAIALGLLVCSRRSLGAIPKLTRVQQRLVALPCVLAVMSVYVLHESAPSLHRTPGPPPWPF